MRRQTWNAATRWNPAGWIIGAVIVLWGWAICRWWANCRGWAICVGWTRATTGTHAACCSWSIRRAVSSYSKTVLSRGWFELPLRVSHWFHAFNAKHLKDILLWSLTKALILRTSALQSDPQSSFWDHSLDRQSWWIKVNTCKAGFIPPRSSAIKWAHPHWQLALSYAR